MRRVIGRVCVLVLLGGVLATAAQLPPEIMADRHLVEAEKLIAAKEPGKALEAMNKIIALQQQHNLTLPDVFHFKYAEMAHSAGSFQAAIDSVNKYLAAAGRDGKFYRKALELLVSAEQEEEHRTQEEVRRIQEEERRQQIRPIEPDMVVIPAGKFRMGCVSGKDCEDYEKPVHEVQVKSFELGKYEVTFEEYDRFTDASGRDRMDDRGWGRGRRPVSVSWEGAVAYTKWLAAKTGEPYRLPTEAEWEYAARAGSKKKYSWGNKIGHNRANCDACGSEWDGIRTAPVGSFAANRWGLHDMHGNVREWTQDCLNDSYRGAPVDGSAWKECTFSMKVSRGGAWSEHPRRLRSAHRDSTTDFRDYSQWTGGFRVARTVTP